MLTKFELIEMLLRIRSHLEDAYRGLEFNVTMDEEQYLDVIEQSCEDIQLLIDGFQKDRPIAYCVISNQSDGYMVAAYNTEDQVAVTHGPFLTVDQAIQFMAQHYHMNTRSVLSDD